MSAQTALALFTFGEQVIRVLDQQGEPWWVAADVCAALGIANPRQAVGRLDTEDVCQADILDARGCGQKTNVVNEAGLYDLILRSDKPEAKTFKRWITKEVLPAIRKTGSYSLSAGVRTLGEPPVSGNSELEQLLQVKAWLVDALAQFVAGALSPRRLNAMSKAVVRVYEGLDREWKVRRKSAEEEREQEIVLEIIDRLVFGGTPHPQQWEGPAAALEDLLTAEGSPYRNQARKLFSYSSAMGQTLGRLVRMAPLRISRRMLHGVTLWRILAPDNLPASDVSAQPPTREEVAA